MRRPAAAPRQGRSAGSGLGRKGIRSGASASETGVHRNIRRRQPCATGPATFALTNEVFGRRDAPVIVPWIFAGHQVGGALAAFGAGAVRTVAGDYLVAFLASGLACLVASFLVLRIANQRFVSVAAE